VGAREKEIAKKLLRRGISANAVAEDTGLDESTVQELQTELSEAV
jgi:DNA-binding NarL/FixJ family response regulator